MDVKEITKMIDVSSVRAETTLSEIDCMVKGLKHFQFLCAFAMPCFTERLVQMLSDEADIMVGGVVGFPSGADTTGMKVATAKELISFGVDELDMVINIGALKSGLYEEVYRDIRAVVETANGMPVKSILEVSHLTEDEIRRGAEIAVRAGVTYVKTGTGWTGKPTTVESIKIIKSEIGDAALIKAAGGIKNLSTLMEMKNAGASRFGIGINGAVSIMKEVYEVCGLPWDYKEDL